MCAGMLRGNREIVTERESQEEKGEYLSLAARRDRVGSSRHPVMTVRFEVAANPHTPPPQDGGRVPWVEGPIGVRGGGGGR